MSKRYKGEKKQMLMTCHLCSMGLTCPNYGKHNPAPNNPDKEAEKIFFDKLADILDEQFPKGECKERGHALVLNAYANIYFKEALVRHDQEIRKEVVEKAIKIVKSPAHHLKPFGYRIISIIDRLEKLKDL